MQKKYLTNNPSQTKKLGEKVAKEILKRPTKKQALVFGLEGNLGGGKTTFLQGFARGLGIKEKILSPTFVILKKFKMTKTKSGWFYHIDCYRIKKAEEILELGFKEIISDSQNIIAIEWAGRIKKILPDSITWVRLDFINKNTRKITVK